MTSTTEFGGDALGARFGGEVFIIAGQPRQPVEHRRRRLIAQGGKKMLNVIAQFRVLESCRQRCCRPS
jgi:hypothetical protein